MFDLNGKYGSATIFTDDIEQVAMSQIINLLNQPMAEGANVRIMPDVHVHYHKIMAWSTLYIK